MIYFYGKFFNFFQKMFLNVDVENLRQYLKVFIYVFCRMVLLEVDVDEDGKVLFDEFIVWIQGILRFVYK